MMTSVPLPEEVDHDAMLMEAVQKQDRDCFHDLVQRNDRWVRGVVYSVLTDGNLLDDVMQKVWLAVWQRCGTLDDVRRWRHWLYRMARNAAIDAGRKKQRQRSLRQRFTHEIRGRGRSGHGDPRKSASVKEQHRRVLNAIDVMPAIYKEPFVLRHMEGWSYKEIADTLDLPVDTVGTRLVRARRLLQDTLSDVELG